MFVGTCCLETTRSGGCDSSLFRRRDEAHIEQAGNHFGSMRVALGTGERFSMLCSFVLTTFLSSGPFITEEGISPRLADSQGSRVEELRVTNDSLALFCVPGKATRTF
jgi:hypothetical protein